MFIYNTSVPDPNSLEMQPILDDIDPIIMSKVNNGKLNVWTICQDEDYNFKMSWRQPIGKYNVAILNEIKDLYIYDFGIFIDIAPDEEEKAQLEANIQMALQQKDINLEDAIDIREISNIKLANQSLIL